MADEERRAVRLQSIDRANQAPWTASRGVEGWDQNITRPRACRSLPCRPSPRPGCGSPRPRSEEHTSELQSHVNLVCRLLLEKKNNKIDNITKQKKITQRH